MPPNRTTSGNCFPPGAVVFLLESRNLDYLTGARFIVGSCPMDLEPGGEWLLIEMPWEERERERERIHPGFPFLFQSVSPIG